jgi:heat-inducible transcriptional repressor
MAALEEMGYLAQPHTSAGRIPTDLGYRHYVDNLPRRVTLPQALAREIEGYFGDRRVDLDELLHGTAALLSKLTGYAAVALTPRTSGGLVLRAELVPVGSGLMLLVVSDAGRVDKRMLELDTEPDAKIVERASRMLSERLAGLDYDEAAERAAGLAREIADEERRLVRDVADAIRDLRATDAEHVFVGGVANIADEHAFERRETLRELVETLEERAAVLEIVAAVSGAMEDVTVRIGHENPLRALAEASVVVGWYGPDEEPAGAIAVVGPTRMEYPRAISAAQAVAGRLSDLMSGLVG